MTTPFDPKEKINGKLVYAARNLSVVPAATLWPNRTDTEGVYVLTGEMYVHDGWHDFRSSTLVQVIGNDHETRNSVYRAIDKP